MKQRNFFSQGDEEVYKTTLFFGPLSGATAFR
jgi:hypothetical protein